MILNPNTTMRSPRNWRGFRHYRIKLLFDGGVYIVRPTKKDYAVVVIALIGPTLGM